MSMRSATPGRCQPPEHGMFLSAFVGPDQIGRPTPACLPMSHVMHAG